MALHKNEIIPLTIESLSSDGSGVGIMRARQCLCPPRPPAMCCRHAL